MGRRKIFTKREYEKLSKTHEGRQTINKTYCAVSFLSLGGFLAFSIFCISSSYMKNIAIIGFIGAIISLIIAVFCIIAYKSEANDEKERVAQRQKNQQLIAEANARRLEADRLAREQKDREEQERLFKFKNSNMDEIDRMTGYEFEEFITVIMEDLGYNAITTQKSGDFGVDIILKKGNEKIIIQTKRYAKKVSLNAVQEISSAKQYYNIQTAWVITNNYFTEPAIALAKANNIKLVERNQLADLIIQAKQIRESNKQSA